MKHRIEINVDENGFGSTILNGQDISEVVTAIGINTDVGEKTEVTLVLSNLDVNFDATLLDVTLVERRLLEQRKDS